MFHTKTIWDNLRRAKVPSAYYYTDLPIAPLWGQRLYDVTHSLDRLLRRRVEGEARQRGDGRSRVPVRAAHRRPPGRRHPRRTALAALGVPGVRPVTAVGAWRVPRALRRVGRVLRPREAADWHRARRRASSTAGSRSSGFRVPAIVASPFARAGYADHTVYDHTSVLRLLEWRFLGAPAQGTAAGTHGNVVAHRTRPPRREPRRDPRGRAAGRARLRRDDGPARAGRSVHLRGQGRDVARRRSLRLVAGDGGSPGLALQEASQRPWASVS